MRFLCRLVFPPALLLAAFVLPLPAQAALTTAQVHAILSVLESFGVDASIVLNVRAILEGKPDPRLPLSGNQASSPSLVILSPAAGTTIPGGGPLTVRWQGLYANSVYVLSLSPADRPIAVLTSTSVTAYNAGCSVDLSCAYTWTPDIAGTTTILTVREQMLQKSGTISPLLFGSR